MKNKVTTPATLPTEYEWNLEKRTNVTVDAFIEFLRKNIDSEKLEEVIKQFNAELIKNPPPLEFITMKDLKSNPIQQSSKGRVMNALRKGRSRLTKTQKEQFDKNFPQLQEYDMQSKVSDLFQALEVLRVKLTIKSQNDPTNETYITQLKSLDKMKGDLYSTGFNTTY